MKIFNWMQIKLNGSNGRKKSNSVSGNNPMLNYEPCKEEFSDWPEALLAIGTFGNNNLKHDPEGKTNTADQDSSSSQDFLQELMSEEAGNLPSEQYICGPGQVESNFGTEDREEGPNDHNNKHLNYESSSLELQRTENDKTCSDGSNSNSEICHQKSILIPCRVRDHCLDNSNNTRIGKKSLSFLLKKVFVCRSGFQSTANFKDPLCTESRVEKILRAILRKKVYPQGASPTMSLKKYLEDKHILKPSSNGEDESDAITENGCKWVKTDSEYIVLEI